MWISRSNIPPGAHTKAKFTLATSAGCTTRPEPTHTHARTFSHSFTQSHILPEKPIHIFYNSKSKLWPPVESLTVAADLLFSCLTRWLTEALHSLLLKLSHKQSPCRPQSSTTACHDGLFYCIITSQIPPRLLTGDEADGYGASPPPSPARTQKSTTGNHLIVAK